MKFLIAALLFVPSLLLAAPVPGLLGHWQTETPLHGRGVDFDIHFNFTPTETELAVHCAFFQGAQLTAVTSSAVTYQNNEICVQEQHQTVTDDGVHFCRATISPARWTIYFDGTGKMVLFIPAPYQAQFNLIPVTTNPLM